MVAKMPYTVVGNVRYMYPPSKNGGGGSVVVFCVRAKPITSFAAGGALFTVGLTGPDAVAQEKMGAKRCTQQTRKLSHECHTLSRTVVSSLFVDSDVDVSRLFSFC